jgi:predicted nucleic acid-binding protein
MIILISDANILIDMEEGDLLDALFELPYQFTVPDLLYFDELETHHADLLDKGLVIGELSSTTMRYAIKLIERVRGPSRNDCFAIALAKQEICPLLTGDRALKKVANEEGLEVHGTLWVVEAMVEHQIISVETARRAYYQMRDNGRRLPWDIAFAQLARLVQ